MKRILYITLLMLIVGLAYSQSTISKNAATWSTKSNLIDKGSFYSNLVSIAGTAGAMTFTKGTAFLVSGTTKQTSITTTAAESGRLLILVMVTTDSLTDGGNLKLAGDFNGTANDVIWLIGDGVNFYEIFRSIN